MAALIAASTEPTPDFPFVSLNSEGVTLIYGKDERAIEAANLLKTHLDVTVLIKPEAEVTPMRVTEFPVVMGTMRTAKGYLGAFEATVDEYAAPSPSSRGSLNSDRHAMARYRAVRFLLISPAARRCSAPPICAMAIYAPIRAIRLQSCAQCSRPGI